MAGISPTQNTLKKLRADGYLSAVVEKWNHHANIRQDLFGVIDVLGIGNGETVAVQSTSYSNVSARIKKLEDSDALAIMRESNWIILVHGWRKVKNKWVCREVNIS